MKIKQIKPGRIPTAKSSILQKCYTQNGNEYIYLTKNNETIFIIKYNAR